MSRFLMLLFLFSGISMTQTAFCTKEYINQYWYCIKCGGTNTDDVSCCRFCGQSR